jgi:RNA polymerase sigma-70 factor (ECF subfamily)
MGLACTEESPMRASPAQMASAPRSRREEIESLYVQYGPVVMWRCRYLLRNREAARDATQEVFVRALRGIDDFRGESSISTWLVTIATNYCLNQLQTARAPWRRRFQEQKTLEADIAEEQAGESLDVSEDVRRLLGLLDRETQLVAIHYFVDEMTQEEIGRLLNRSLPTVRKRINKFLEIAKRELGHANV